jgi:hypothetical protein
VQQLISLLHNIQHVEQELINMLILGPKLLPSRGQTRKYNLFGLPAWVATISDLKIFTLLPPDANVAAL